MVGHVHTLDGTITVGVPLLRLGNGNLVKDELRRRNKLSGKDGIGFHIAILVNLCSMTIQTLLEVIGKELEDRKNTLSRPLSGIIANIHTLQELLYLLEGDCAMCYIILVFCQEMLHAKLTEVLRGNYLRVIRFETEIIGYAVQLAASQEELRYFRYLGDERIKGGIENGFDEGDGIGDGIILPPGAINTARKGFVGTQFSTIHVLDPVTLAGLAICIRLYFRDDALQIDVIKFLFAYQLGGIFDRVAV